MPNQNLCALACLCVLVCNVVYIYVVLNVLEVLYAGILYGNLLYSGTQSFHQIQGICVCAVCGAESGHGNSDYIAVWLFQYVEGLHGHKQCQGRVTKVYRKSGSATKRSPPLYHEYIIVTRFAFLFAWDERQWVYAACKSAARACALVYIYIRCVAFMCE